jgi:signal transduction histidine kinase
MNRILVVDDDTVTRHLVGRAFSPEEADLQFAENGAEALEKAATFRPDLVILDIMMPEIDGYEVCRRLKADPDLSSAMVLLLSAKTKIDDRLRGYEIQADDYMIKPFDLKELKAKARILLRLKNAQDELKQINGQLESLVEAKTRALVKKERQAMIGQLLQGIIHNLRSPLSVVQFKAELSASEAEDLISRDPDDPIDWEARITTLLQKQKGILEAVSRIDQIIDNLMDKSKREACEGGEKIDLNELIVREMAFLESDMELKHGVIKEIELAPDLPEIHGVYSDFSQVVYNMVSNAIDAMRGAERKQLSVKTRWDDGQIYLEFSDTGDGIAPENHARIFEAFFSTKPGSGASRAANPSGTGLGLFICSRLMETYGGKISVSSRPRAGTTFTVSIPR